MKNLSKEKEYDDDAHQMTSQEVLHDIEEATAEDSAKRDAIQRHRFGSLVEFDKFHALAADSDKPEARESTVRTDENLKPLVQKSV